jgi:1,4-alpha-glucan branching enzyme
MRILRFAEWTKVVGKSVDIINKIDSVGAVRFHLNLKQEGKMVQISPRTKKVDFTLSGVQASDVFVVGDFNKWSKTKHRMKKQKESWKLSVKLPAGEHKFKYLVDGNWLNDPAAHKYVENPYGSEDSVVVVPDTRKTRN